MTDDQSSTQHVPGEASRTIDGPLIAALRCGRYLTRWQYFAVQHWFGAPEAAAHCAETYELLSGEARRLVAVAERHEFMQHMRDLQQTWRTLLDEEWRAEQRIAAVQLLAMREHDDAYATLRRSEVAGLRANVTDLAKSTRCLIQRHLDQTGIAAMNLGEWLELGQCPEEVAEALPGRAGEYDLRLESMPARVESGFVLARRFFAVADLSPPTRWREELDTRWAELVSYLERRGGVATSTVPEASGMSTPDFVTLAATTFEHRIHAAEYDENDGAVSDSSAGFLGLILESRAFTVRRQGLTKELDFAQRRLDWEILGQLMRGKRGFTTDEDLTIAWRAADRKRRPSKRTIDNQLSKLRGSLEELGLSIHGSHKDGWRLERLRIPRRKPNRKDRN